MQTPLFYIIIPIYNVEKYLKTCLDSIKNQTYTNFKAIMINDGSTDNSAEIAQSYTQDERFILINQDNAGVSVARNTGLDYVKQDIESSAESNTESIGGGWIISTQAL